MKNSLLIRTMAIFLVTVTTVFGLCVTNVSAASLTDAKASLLPADDVNFHYQTLSNGKLMITGADKFPSELIIPAQIDGVDVEKISLHAFSYKWQLETVIISQGIEVIGEYAFSECTNLKTVVIPESVRVIEDDAFYYCDKIEEIYIVGAEIIEMNAFCFCKALEKVYISKNLKEVEFGAFYGCDSLTEVYYAGTLEDIYNLEIATSNEPFLNAELYLFEIEPEYKLGDVDGDSEVSIIDATEIQRHLAQVAVIPADRMKCADTDKDGQVSIMDATQIQRMLANLV